VGEGRFEVELSGATRPPVELPLPGFAGSASVEPRDGASLDRSQGRLTLVASRPGRYAVATRGRLRAEEVSGVERLALPAAQAPVAVAEVDLPADLAWSAPRAVVAAERVEAGRRRLRLALPRGQATWLEVRRRAAGAEEERVLARAAVVTLVELLPAGVRAHDVVLYEVLRGELARLAVELPPGRGVDLAATDEGEVAPVVADGRLIVERVRRLTGVGHLVLTRREPLPGAGGEVSLAPVVPREEVRARYLVLASSVAAEAHPVPEDSWRRVDLEDLPAPLRTQVDALVPTAVWRLDEGAPAGLALKVEPLPAAPRFAGIIRRRETTTVLSLDGTLLHRERLALDPGPAALELTLPAAATLWTALVDGAPVRPVERQGRTLLPLPYRQNGAASVEVIAVEERVGEKGGRSRLALALLRIEGQVLDHTWRLLLPEGRRYRLAAGTLGPAPLPPEAAGERSSVSLSWRASGPGGSSLVLGTVVDTSGQPLPGVAVTLSSPALQSPLVTVTDAGGSFRFDGLARGKYTIDAELAGFSPVESLVNLPSGRGASMEVTLSAGVEEVITVTSESPLLDARAFDRINIGGNEASARSESRAELERLKTAFDLEARSLHRGLVGGVKPLPLAIPESGKLLFLAGALPPREVTVELEVKGRR
jgi:hypothetical protein